MSMPIVSIISAKLVAPFQIELIFDDKHRQVVDFQPFLAHSQHPAIRAYLQPERFAGFDVSHGELKWGDFDLCFPMADLYENNIEHHHALGEAA